MQNRLAGAKTKGAAPFEQKSELSVLYAQPITRSLVDEARFISIQVFGR